MRERGRCWNCSTPLDRGSRAGVEFDTCVSCGLSFVDGRHWEPIRGSEAEHVESYPVPGGGSCCARGDEPVTDRRLRVIGRRCLSCGRVSLSTEALLSALRIERARAAEAAAAASAAPGETLWTGTVSRRRRSRAAVADEERNRVFAFLFGVPLEFSDEVSPRPPVVLATISVCAVVFLALLIAPDLAGSVALDVSRVSWLTPVQLVTSVLMHWDLLHLGGNMYFLYVFGRTVETHLGSAVTFGILSTSGLAGGLSSLLVRLGEDTLAGGASGAVAGVLGAYFVLFPSRFVGLSLFFWVLKVPAFIYLGFWFVFQLLAGGGPGGIAYEAHLGGFAAGALGAVLSRRRRRSASVTQDSGPRAAVR